MDPLLRLERELARLAGGVLEQLEVGGAEGGVVGGVERADAGAREELLDGLEGVDVGGDRVVAAVADAPFVAAPDGAGARLFGRVAEAGDRAGEGFLAAEGHGALAAGEVERRAPHPVGRGGAGLDVHLGRGQAELVVHLEEDAGDLVVLGGAVGLRAAEVDGLAEVVVDGAPLPPEVAQLVAELGLGGASGGEVGAVVGREDAVEVGERAHLEAVEVLAHHPFEVDEHQRLVGGAGRAVAEVREGGGLGGEAGTGRGLVRAAGVVGEAFDEADRRVGGDAPRVVVGGVLPVREEPVAHAGEAEREDVVPVGRAV